MKIVMLVRAGFKPAPTCGCFVAEDLQSTRSACPSCKKVAAASGRKSIMLCGISMAWSSCRLHSPDFPHGGEFLEARPFVACNRVRVAGSRARITPISSRNQALNVAAVLSVIGWLWRFSKKSAARSGVKLTDRTGIVWCQLKLIRNQISISLPARRKRGLEFHG
jgi:hypothetical protein